MRSLLLLLLTMTAPPLLAGPKITIVVGPNAPKLEQFAARELAAQLKKLAASEVTIAEKAEHGEQTILLGSPATNPAVKAAIGAMWPKLPKEGHILRSTKSGLVVGGAGPVATLWAACELGHHFGIRSMLHGDFYPEKTPELTFDDIAMSFSPTLPVRGWVIDLASPNGFGAWNMDEIRLFLKQLAKLKFNTISIIAPNDWPTIKVSGDTPGRKAFRGVKEFKNPYSTPESREQLVREISQAAKDLGLTVEMGRAPAKVEISHQFSVLPGTAEVPRTGGLMIHANVPASREVQAYTLSRRGFQSASQTNDVVASLYVPLLGKASADRVQLGMEALRTAIPAELPADELKSFGVPEPKMIEKALNAKEPAPKWWAAAREKQTEAMNEMYRGIRGTFNTPARDPLLYRAKRCEFALHYITAMEAVRLAGVARAKDDKEMTILHLEKAIESMYNALNACSDVARDASDRAVIATLTEFAYRPLKAELKAIEAK